MNRSKMGRKPKRILKQGLTACLMQWGLEGWRKGDGSRGWLGQHEDWAALSLQNCLNCMYTLLRRNLTKEPFQFSIAGAQTKPSSTLLQYI